MNLSKRYISDFSKIFSSKKRIIILSAVALLIVAGSYVAYSVLAWQNHATEYSSSINTWKRQLNHSLLTDSTSEQGSQAKLANLKAYSTDAPSPKICEPARAVAWQQSLDSVGSSVEKCERETSKAELLSKKLRRVVVYLEDERRLANILSEAASLKAKQSESDWSRSTKTWKRVHADVDKLKVSEEFLETKKLTASTTKDITQAWQRLIAAHKAQNKTKFEAAQAELKNAYAALDDVEAENRQQLEKRIEAFNETYHQVYD